MHCKAFPDLCSTPQDPQAAELLRVTEPDSAESCRPRNAGKCSTPGTMRAAAAGALGHGRRDKAREDGDDPDLALQGLYDRLVEPAWSRRPAHYLVGHLPDVAFNASRDARGWSWACTAHAGMHSTIHCWAVPTSAGIARVSCSRLVCSVCIGLQPRGRLGLQRGGRRTRSGPTLRWHSPQSWAPGPRRRSRRC